MTSSKGVRVVLCVLSALMVTGSLALAYWYRTPRLSLSTESCRSVVDFVADYEACGRRSVAVEILGPLGKAVEVNDVDVLMSWEHEKCTLTLQTHAKSRQDLLDLGSRIVEAMASSNADRQMGMNRLREYCEAVELETSQTLVHNESKETRAYVAAHVSSMQDDRALLWVVVSCVRAE